MADAQRMGMNRTGMQMSPLHSKAMLETIQGEVAPVKGDPLADIGKSYMSHSAPVGTVPLPGSMKGAVKAAAEKLRSGQPTTLINKLGERLAFERAGVRLYEALIRKCMVKQSGSDLVEVPLERLQKFRNDEEEHFHLLAQAIEKMGADPTAQTPDADVSGVAGMGLVKVIADPRTSVRQSLEAMLMAELVDHAAWHVLIDLARGTALDDMIPRFQDAEQLEEVHLNQIKEWHKALLGAE